MKRLWTTIYEDENLISGSFHETEEQAITEWEQQTGEKWVDGHPSTVTQSFTQEEINALPTN